LFEKCLFNFVYHIPNTDSFSESNLLLCVFCGLLGVLCGIAITQKAQSSFTKFHKEKTENLNEMSISTISPGKYAKDLS